MRGIHPLRQHIPSIMLLSHGGAHGCHYHNILPRLINDDQSILKKRICRLLPQDVGMTSNESISA